MVARVTFNLTLAPGVTTATSVGRFTIYVCIQLRSHPGGVIALSHETKIANTVSRVTREP